MLKVIYQPDPPASPKPNKPLAQEYPLGTIVEDDSGNQWKVEWDPQDHNHMWEQIHAQ